MVETMKLTIRKRLSNIQTNYERDHFSLSLSITVVSGVNIGLVRCMWAHQCAGTEPRSSQYNCRCRVLSLHSELWDWRPKVGEQNSYRNVIFKSVFLNHTEKCSGKVWGS